MKANQRANFLTNMVKIRSILVCLFAIVCSQFAIAEQVKELYWEDMIPEDYVLPDVEISHSGSMAQIAPDAPLVDSLNGLYVKIPGFIVPLDGDETSLSEFLLVPYFGACIHVPPPPSNQIVHVKFSEGIPVESLYDAVLVSGRLSTKGWVGDLASVGYSMSGSDIELYQW